MHCERAGLIFTVNLGSFRTYAAVPRMRRSMYYSVASSALEKLDALRKTHNLGRGLDVLFHFVQSSGLDKHRFRLGIRVGEQGGTAVAAKVSLDSEARVGVAVVPFLVSP